MKKVVARKGPKFERNAITPGTEFMQRLTEHLHFFAAKKMKEDPTWSCCQEVIVSGPEVPGEGEHKIINYIRQMKNEPDYDPHTWHCVYGLDADLVKIIIRFMD